MLGSCTQFVNAQQQEPVHPSPQQIPIWAQSSHLVLSVGIFFLNTTYGTVIHTMPMQPGISPQRGKETLRDKLGNTRGGS